MFPEDVNLENNCLALATDTIKYFDGRLVETAKSKQNLDSNENDNSGLFGWVDVETGDEPKILLTLTHDYGAVANALAYLAQKTDNPQLMQWADQKLEFVWQNRMNPHLPVLNEQFIPFKKHLVIPGILKNFKVGLIRQ